jgi:MaoC dehydratase-like protein
MDERSDVSLLTPEVLAFKGRTSARLEAPEPVEAGAVRRYAQAIMDEDPIYAEGRNGGPPLAPALFPTHMFRSPLGDPDIVSERAADPDFDGAVGSSIRGLPDLPLPPLVRLNGGMEIDLFRRARHGERVCMTSRYADIVEKQGSKGPMLLVTIETDYVTAEGQALLRVRNTSIFR